MDYHSLIAKKALDKNAYIGGTDPETDKKWTRNNFGGEVSNILRSSIFNPKSSNQNVQHFGVPAPEYMAIKEEIRADLLKLDALVKKYNS